jgi:Domain of unknown function (DUF3303)
LLFLVISSPRPERPSSVAKYRQAYWRWIEPKLKSKQALFAYPKAGRGVVVALNVRSHEELHALLNEWADIIPAAFEVIPLVDTAQAKRYLKKK